MDANELIRHCNEKSAEDLSPLQGQWVAWSEDGAEILASARELDTLFREIDERGLTRYVLDRFPSPDEDFLGGATI
jgi:hypothetical protein